LLLLSGCAASHGSSFAAHGPSDLPSPLLIAAGDAPALFLGADADSPAVAFLSSRVPLLVAGASEGQRVPVRIDGSLRMRGYVPRDALRLRVQRRGRLRGAPLYAGPGDLLQVLGPSAEPERVAVRASLEVAGQTLGPFDGTYPSIGLAAHDAPVDAEPAPPGRRYVLAAGSKLELRELPSSAPHATLTAASGPLPFEVLNEQQGFAAVRVGSGPYVIGWSQLPPDATESASAAASASAAPSAAPASSTINESASAAPAAAEPAIPSRIAAEAGELRRVASGTKVAFGKQVIAVFKAPGWARVLKSYDAGYADVFAAVDEDVAVRGLVRTSDLSPPASSATPLNETQPIAAPR